MLEEVGSIFTDILDNQEHVVAYRVYFYKSRTERTQKEHPHAPGRYTGLRPPFYELPIAFEQMVARQQYLDEHDIPMPSSLPRRML